MQSLLSDVQLFDDSSVSLDVDLLQVVEQISSVSYHFEKTAAAVIVLVIVFEMLGQIVYSVCENRNLNFRRTRVSLVNGVFLNNSLLFLCGHFCFTFQKI